MAIWGAPLSKRHAGVSVLGCAIAMVAVGGCAQVGPVEKGTTGRFPGWLNWKQLGFFQLPVVQGKERFFILHGFEFQFLSCRSCRFQHAILANGRALDSSLRPWLLAWHVIHPWRKICSRAPGQIAEVSNELLVDDSSRTFFWTVGWPQFADVLSGRSFFFSPVVNCRFLFFTPVDPQSTQIVRSHLVRTT